MSGADWLRSVNRQNHGSKSQNQVQHRRPATSAQMASFLLGKDRLGGLLRGKLSERARLTITSPESLFAPCFERDDGGRAPRRGFRMFYCGFHMSDLPQRRDRIRQNLTRSVIGRPLLDK